MSDLTPQACGEIWTVVTAARTLTVVVVDDDPTAARAPFILCAHIRAMLELPDGGGLLAVPLDPERVVSVLDVHSHARRRFSERVGALTADQLAAVRVALAARLGLNT